LLSYCLNSPVQCREFQGRISLAASTISAPGCFCGGSPWAAGRVSAREREPSRLGVSLGRGLRRALWAAYAARARRRRGGEHRVSGAARGDGGTLLGPRQRQYRRVARPALGKALASSRQRPQPQPLLLLLPRDGAAAGETVVISGSVCSVATTQAIGQQHTSPVVLAARRPQAGEALGSDRGYFHGSCPLEVLFYTPAAVAGLADASCASSSAQVAAALLRAVVAAIGACRGSSSNLPQ